MTFKEKVLMVLGMLFALAGLVAVWTGKPYWLAIVLWVFGFGMGFPKKFKSLLGYVKSAFKVWKNPK